MRENNENILKGTEAALALGVLLLNFLILAAVVGVAWSLKLLISASAPFASTLGETIWR